MFCTLLTAASGSVIGPYREFRKKKVSWDYPATLCLSAMGSGPLTRSDLALLQRLCSKKRGNRRKIRLFSAIRIAFNDCADYGQKFPSAACTRICVLDRYFECIPALSFDGFAEAFTAFAVFSEKSKGCVGNAKENFFVGDRRKQ